MKEQCRVETVEEFKLRIAAIIRAKPEEIPSPRRPDRILVRRNKRATHRKANVEQPASTRLKHEYEVRPRKDKRGVDLISDALPFGRLLYGEP